MTDYKTVAVLGGGFLGVAVTLSLRRAGHEVRLVSRSSRLDGSPELALVDRVVLDVANVVALADLLAGCDVAVYAVGSPPPATAVTAHDQGLQESLLPLIGALEACRASGFRGDFIFISSGGAVYGDTTVSPVAEETPPCPISAYGILKMTGEMFVRMYSLKHGWRGLIARVANAYGPHQPLRGQGAIAAFLHAAWAGHPITIYGDGANVRDYVHVEDVADAIARLVGRSEVPSPINIGTGVGTSLNQLVAEICAVTGRALEVAYRPDRGVDVRANVLDVHRMKSTTLIHPRSLTDGLSDTWHRQYLGLAGG